MTGYVLGGIAGKQTAWTKRPRLAGG